MDKNLKPYATTKRRKFFDWNAFLLQDKITNVEWANARRRAGSWVTCACGNQCAIIPRNYEGEPQDEKLMISGMEFYDAIEFHDIETARMVLVNIETRSAYLIKQILHPTT